jgi:hypothetical protein
MNSKHKTMQNMMVKKTLSGTKLDKPHFTGKYIFQHNHGNPKPQHFNARWAGWVPGVNKRGKPCKVWTEDRRPGSIRHISGQ